MTSRAISLPLAATIFLYAAVSGVVDMLFPSDSGVEQTLCRLYICANDLLVATAHERLASGSEDRVQEALPLFNERLRRDPHSPLGWLDLASAHIRIGSHETARICLQQAVRRGSLDARVLLRAGNSYLQLDDIKPALRHLSTVLALVRDYDSVIFHNYLRLGETPLALLRAGVPYDPDASQAFLRSLLRSDVKTADLEAVWTELNRRGGVTPALALSLADELFRRGRRRKAKEVFCGIEGNRCQPAGVNLVLDPDFSGTWATGPFGWRKSEGSGFTAVLNSGLGFEPPQLLTLIFDGAENLQSGHVWLTLIFDGTENLEFGHVWQSVLTPSPGTYRMRARIMSEGLSSAEGVRVRVQDADDPQLLTVQSEAVTGDSNWRVVDSLFVVSEPTELLDLRIVRQRSLKPRDRLRGVIHVDWVSIHLVAVDPGRAEVP